MTIRSSSPTLPGFTQTPSAATHAQPTVTPQVRPRSTSTSSDVLPTQNRLASASNQPPRTALLPPSRTDASPAGSQVNQTKVNPQAQFEKALPQELQQPHAASALAGFLTKNFRKIDEQDRSAHESQKKNAIAGFELFSQPTEPKGDEQKLEMLSKFTAMYSGIDAHIQSTHLPRLLNFVGQIKDPQISDKAGQTVLGAIGKISDEKLKADALGDSVSGNFGVKPGSHMASTRKADAQMLSAENSKVASRFATALKMIDELPGGAAKAILEKIDTLNIEEKAYNAKTNAQPYVDQVNHLKEKHGVELSKDDEDY